MGVVCVTGMSCSSLLELESVTRETELLDHHRLAVLCCNLKVLVDIFVSVCNGHREIGVERILSHPFPVVWPDMDVHVVDVRTAVHLLEELQTAFTSVTALTSRRNHVVRVYGLDQGCRRPHEVDESGASRRVRPEAARLVADLP